MCSLMHVKAIGTKKSEILAKITFLGIFGQILPKAPIVIGGGGTLLTLDVNLAKDLGAAGHSPDQVESEI